MMQYKASSISRFYIRFALSLRDKRGKARSFCNFNARYSLHARKSFRKFPALSKLDPSQDERCVTRKRAHYGSSKARRLIKITRSNTRTRIRIKI